MSAPNLSAWDVDSSAFPKDDRVAAKARFALACAVLAPSSHDTRPWNVCA